MGNNLRYSVYITVNLINNHIYIGQHDETQKGIYLGCGVYANKPSTYMHPKYPFQYAVKKYGPKNFRRHIIAMFDNLEDALKLEEILVNKEFLKLPKVYNIAPGGRKGPDTRKTVYKYSLFGEYIESFESLGSAGDSVGGSYCSIGEAARGKHSSFGFLWSYEKKDKLNTNEYTILSGDTPIYIYNDKGIYEHTVYSISEARKYLKCPATSICKALRTKDSVRHHFVSYIKLETYEIPEKFIVRNQKIYQYTLEGDFVKEWNNPTDVWKAFKLKSATNLISALKTGRCFQKFQWRLEKFDKIAPYKLSGKTAPKRVGVYNKAGELIEVFDTQSKMRKKYGSGAVRCLKGYTEFYKDYCFKYI